MCQLLRWPSCTLDIPKPMYAMFKHGACRIIFLNVDPCLVGYLYYDLSLDPHQHCGCGHLCYDLVSLRLLGFCSWLGYCHSTLNLVHIYLIASSLQGCYLIFLSTYPALIQQHKVFVRGWVLLFLHSLVIVST